MLLLVSSFARKLAFLALSLAALGVSRLPAQQPAPTTPASGPAASGQPASGTPAQAAPTPATAPPAAPAYAPISTIPPAPPRLGLNTVVLDPAHGGTDLGARGTEGIRESEVVLQFASAIRKALEGQGFQVITTRDGNENPSFDERSARANGQRGSVFLSIHIASTGLAGTARVYVFPEIPPPDNSTGLLPWDRAQGPYSGLSRKLGDLIQAELAKRFKGSPATAQIAPVRQLRTTAAPAVAIEISSVSVEDRAELDRMIPGIADAIAKGVTSFKPSYIVPSLPTSAGGVQP